TKFDLAIDKAEKPGGCFVSGDGTTIEQNVDNCVGLLVVYTLQPPSPSSSAACDVAKSKAAVKKLGAKIKCHQKAVTSGTLNPACLTTAENKFDAAITKAESRPDCQPIDDGATIEGAVDDCVTVLDLVFPTTTSTSSTSSSTSTSLPPPGMCCAFEAEALNVD